MLDRLVLATGNPGKLAEMRQLLRNSVGTVHSPADLGGALHVEEDAPSLEGNALKKARAYYARHGIAAVADDTGLEVDALNGAPGVLSARFAGPDCNPDDNIDLLLARLAGHVNRSARFRTAVALVSDYGERVFDGVCTGQIVRARRGSGGFGYDPVFLPDGETETFAQLPAARKNAISHRGRAMRALAVFLEESK
jgi:XTP/dITP diphosphohydrolase